MTATLVPSAMFNGALTVRIVTLRAVSEGGAGDDGRFIDAEVNLGRALPPSTPGIKTAYARYGGYGRCSGQVVLDSVEH